MTETSPHVPAAFINAIAEEGSKAEAVRYLQKYWNETCALRAQLAALRAPRAESIADPDVERAAFKKSYQHLDLTEVGDAWLRPMFKHSHVQALWEGWKRRAERDVSVQWSLTVAVHCVVDAFKKSEAQGYHTRDREFAITILEKALSVAPADPLLTELKEIVESISPKRADDLGAIRDRLRALL
jgi:hypothetical protein